MQEKQHIATIVNFVLFFHHQFEKWIYFVSFAIHSLPRPAPSFPLLICVLHFSIFRQKEWFIDMVYARIHSNTSLLMDQI